MTNEERLKIESAPPGILSDVGTYHPEFIHDESHLIGRMDSISFPRSEADVRDQVVSLAKAGAPLTVQGMRSGLTGGAVPMGGHAMSVGRMTRILGLRQGADGAFFMRLEPGVLMREQIWKVTAEKQFDTTGWSDESHAALRAFQSTGNWFFAPDPSEPTVDIGGMVANNSSGARSFLYGPTRPHVERLRVVLADGGVLDLRRGADRARGRAFAVRTDTGQAIEGRLPTYRMPAVKNSAGYFVQDDMDLMDLFIGSEGTLGVITEVEVRLLPAPAGMTGVMAFLSSEAAAMRLAGRVRSANRAGRGQVRTAEAATLEYFDDRSVDFLRNRADVFEKHQMGHAFPAGPVWAIYVEFHGRREDALRPAVEAFKKAIAEEGGEPAEAWIESGGEAIKNFKQIKHMLPEVVNRQIARRQETVPGIRKLGTDLAVPDDRLEELLTVQRRDLEATDWERLTFGHLGDNNLHVNIIPQSMEEYNAGREMYLRWARLAVQLGGTVSAEHGIGKIKHAMLPVMFSDESIDQMKRLKRRFDPKGMMNPGNIFE